MARGIKWRMQFKSLEKVGCLVNIYEDGYTSSADTTKTGLNVPFSVEQGVTELVGAAEPFTFEEGNSNDLLAFVRYNTGYISIVEESYGALDGLNPSSITQHFVEAFYGGRRVFTGYMQCQQFDNSWVAAPRVLNFPVISPLGLLSSFQFLPPGSGFANLGTTKVGEWLHEVLVRINPSASSASQSDYQQVTYPRTDYRPWDSLIPSTTLVPFNDNYKHYDDTESIYSPKDFLFFIDGICSNFGWILHDTPNAVVFSQYDSITNYSRVSVVGLVSLNDRENVVVAPSSSLDTYMSDSDDDALLSMVQPLKKITISRVGGSTKEKSLECVLTYLSSVSGHHKGTGWASRSLEYRGVDVDGPSLTLGTAQFTAAGELSNYGLFPILYAHWEQSDSDISMSEYWVYHHTQGQGYSLPIIRKRFYGVLPSWAGYYMLNLQLKKGTSLKDMKDSWSGNLYFNLSIRCGSKYWQSGFWVTSAVPLYTTVRILADTGHIESNNINRDWYGFKQNGFVFDTLPGAEGFDVIEVALWSNNSHELDTGTLLQFVDFSIVPPGRIFADYEQNDAADTIRKGGGIDEADIAVNINNYYPVKTENCFVNANGALTEAPPSYAYMFKPQYFLQERMKPLVQADHPFLYIQKWIHWKQGWLWKIISISFNLREDEYKINMCRSQIIE